MKLTGVMIGSDDSKKLGNFYTKILGSPGWQQDDWYGFDVGGGNIMIGSHSEVKGKSNMPGRIIITFEVDDVKREFKRIEEVGADVVAVPYQPDKSNNPDTWLATFADPDGNYFQLATPWKN